MGRRRKKRFRETTVGKILLGAVNIANPTLGGLLSEATNVGQALDAIKASDLPPEKKLEFEQLIFEAEVADRDSARQAEIERLKAGSGNDLMSVIGWGSLILMFGMLLAMIIAPELIEGNRMFDIAFGAVSMNFGTVVAYYFGSTHGKK